MTAQFARAPHTSGRPTPPVINAPHAALLIDFDNVTMGIRSDLTKELKSLLNSDIVKGKVAVQRAYADWRRYPQYIVPLAENSVDLIFAPAYGSSKKNATDIRLSIDALELVFTRPEIGTFILLSGDSDFSSLVLKLKEYGKYVIGIGIRESASDLLVQNCDEYYSYSALTGLTKAGDEETKQWDPWEAVEIAVQRMADNDDVMRSDRLKQVILELDPNFDEKAIGFTKFNRFLQEAATRGLLQLNKLENGQFEVAPFEAGAVAGEGAGAGNIRSAGREPQDAGEGEDTPRKSRRERHRDRGARHREERSEAASATAPASTVVPVPVDEPATAPAPAPVAVSKGPATLKESYQILKKAAADVTQANGAARDSDVKRRILEVNPEWNENALGFSKFSRFLRQAHDAEVINLRKLENGNYEIVLPGAAAKDEAASPSGRGRGRGRARGNESERGPRGAGRGRGTARERDAEAAPTPTESKPETKRVSPRPAAPAPPSASREVPAPAPAPTPAPAQTAAASLLFRSGSRKRGGVPSGPPPLLPGQSVGPAKPAAEAAPETAAKKRTARKTAAPAADASVNGKSAAPKKAAKKAAPKKAAAKSAATKAAPTKAGRSRSGTPKS